MSPDTFLSCPRPTGLLEAGGGRSAARGFPSPAQGLLGHGPVVVPTHSRGTTGPGRPGPPAPQAPARSCPWTRSKSRSLLRAVTRVTGSTEEPSAPSNQIHLLC